MWSTCLLIDFLAESTVRTTAIHASILPADLRTVSAPPLLLSLALLLRRSLSSSCTTIVQASVSSELSSAGFCTLTSSSLRWLWGEIFKHRRENNSIEVTLIYAVLSLFCALFKSWLGILDNAIATGNENRLKWWDTQKDKLTKKKMMINFSLSK